MFEPRASHVRLESEVCTKCRGSDVGGVDAGGVAHGSFGE